MNSSDTGQDLPKGNPVASARRALFRRLRPLDATIETIAAHDGQPLRRLIWPALGTPRGTLLFLNGRADFIEKNLESIAGWRRQGWIVTSFDWPGQGGSSRPDHGDYGHIADFDEFVETLSHYWITQVLPLPGPHVIVGHSMGGHLTMRAIVSGLIRPDALALVSPMLGILTQVPRPVAGFLTNLVARIGYGRRPAPASTAREAEIGRQTILTGDRERYDDEQYWLEKEPALATGVPSWSWLAAAYRSMGKLLPARVLARIDVPTLVLFSGHDTLVDPEATRRAVALMPSARAHCYGNKAAHELLREVDTIRDDVLARITAFFDAEAPVR